MAGPSTIDAIGQDSQPKSSGGGDSRWKVPDSHPTVQGVAIDSLAVVRGPDDRITADLTKSVRLAAKYQLYFRGRGLKYFNRANIYNLGSGGALNGSAILNDAYGNDGLISLTLPAFKDFEGPVELELVSDINKRLTAKLKTSFNYFLDEDEEAKKKAKAAEDAAKAAQGNKAKGESSDLMTAALAETGAGITKAVVAGVAAGAPAASAKPEIVKPEPVPSGPKKLTEDQNEALDTDEEAVGTVGGEVESTVETSGGQVSAEGTVSVTQQGNIQSGGTITGTAEVNTQVQSTSSGGAGQISATVSGQETAGAAASVTATGQTSGGASRAGVGGTVLRASAGAGAGRATANLKTNLQTAGSFLLDGRQDLIVTAQSNITAARQTEIRTEVMGALAGGSTRDLSDEAKISLKATLKQLTKGENGQSAEVTAAAGAADSQLDSKQVSAGAEASIQENLEVEKRARQEAGLPPMNQNQEEQLRAAIESDYWNNFVAQDPEQAENLKDELPPVQQALDRQKAGNEPGGAGGARPIQAPPQGPAQDQQPGAEPSEPGELSEGPQTAGEAPAAAGAAGRAGGGKTAGGPGAGSTKGGAGREQQSKAGEEIMRNLRSQEEAMDELGIGRGPRKASIDAASEGPEGEEPPLPPGETLTEQETDVAPPLGQVGGLRGQPPSRPPKPSPLAGRAKAPLPSDRVRMPQQGAGAKTAAGTKEGLDAESKPGQVGAGRQKGGKAPEGKPEPDSEQDDEDKEDQAPAGLPKVPVPGAAAGGGAAGTVGGQVAGQLAGQVTSKFWYWAFGLSAGTFFTGLDFLVGALLMDIYWIFMHSRQPELFPLKRWQKIMTVVAHLLPVVWASFFFGIVLYLGCNVALLPAGLNQYTNYNTSVLGLAGYADTCKSFMSLPQGLSGALNGQVSPAPTTPGSPAQGCSPVPVGAASPTQLASGCFGTLKLTVQASIVANKESGGTFNRASDSDICLDQNGNYVPYNGQYASSSSKKNGQSVLSVSWGLFQINLTAHKLTLADGTVLDCPSAVGPMYTGSQHQCAIKNAGLFDRCVGAAIDPNVNVPLACQIYKSQGWGAWGTSAQQCVALMGN